MHEERCNIPIHSILICKLRSMLAMCVMGVEQSKFNVIHVTVMNINSKLKLTLVNTTNVVCRIYLKQNSLSSKYNRIAEQI